MTPANSFKRRAGVLATLAVVGFLLQACVTAPSPGSDRGQAEAHYDRAVAYYARGRYDEAIEQYQLALQDWPAFREAHFGLGASFIKTGFYRGAVLALQRAIDLADAYPEAHLNLGIARAALDRHEEAVASFRAALSQDADGDGWYPLARSLETLGRDAEAVDAYTRATADRPYDAQVALAALHKRLGDRDRLVAHLTAAAAADTTRHEPRYDLGVLHEAEGAYLEALDAYAQARSIRPELPGLDSRIAGVYAHVGQADSALVYYQKVVDATPGDVTALFNLAVTLDTLERVDEAIGVYRRVIDREPTFADAHLNLAIDLVEKRAFGEALAAYEAFLVHAGPGERRERVEEIVSQLRVALGR